MEKRSLPNLESILSKQQIHFYSKEILPDLQVRLNTIKKEKENIPDAVFNHVGMDTINAQSNPGKYFVEFASSATIHGFNHLVAPHRHPIEKLLAIIFILGALICLIFLSLFFWDRYQNETTVVVILNNRDEFKIDKPSYILRPVVNFKSGNVSDIFKAHGVEYSSETENFFRFLSGVTYDTMDQTPGFDRVPSDKWLDLLYALKTEITSEILKFTNGAMSGQWMITERGLCLALRSNIQVYASFEYWKQNNFTVIPFPKDIPYYDYDSSHTDTEAITVDHNILIAPWDPNDLLPYHIPMRVVFVRSMHVATLILSQLLLTDEVKDLSVQQRQCKIPSDGGLTSWPIYSQGMCIFDCRIRIIKDKCGCRPHFARPISGVPICNAQQLKCISEIKKLLFLQKNSPHCACIRNCHSVSYETDTVISEMKDGTPTNLSIYRTVVQFPSKVYRRTVIFGFNAFLTSVGGAAGLFLGASVLSFVEILYYFTLRMFVYICRLRHNNKKKAIPRIVKVYT